MLQAVRCTRPKLSSRAGTSPTRIPPVSSCFFAQYGYSSSSTVATHMHIQYHKMPHVGTH
jgi:hypothetical protein